MRLIDADNILDFIDNAIKTAHGIGLRPAAALCLKKRIEDEPTIDPVVRCKDCKWFGGIGCAIEVVDDTDKPTENDYCSFAERRSDG